MNKLKMILNFKKDLQEFRFYEVIKGYRYFGLKEELGYTYEGIGKHYCSIGLWWYEIRFFNSLKK